MIEKVAAEVWCKEDNRFETHLTLRAAIEARLKEKAEKAKREAERFDRLLARMEES